MPVGSGRAVIRAIVMLQLHVFVSAFRLPASRVFVHAKWSAWLAKSKASAILYEPAHAGKRGKFAFSLRTVIDPARCFALSGSITVHNRSPVRAWCALGELENANLRGGESHPLDPCEQRA